MFEDALELAIEVAVVAHAGQRDKIGQPAILHPLAVMHTLRGTNLERIVAVLHDVFEDTDHDIHEVVMHISRGMDVFAMIEVSEALHAITHRDDESTIYLTTCLTTD